MLESRTCMNRMLLAAALLLVNMFALTTHAGARDAQVEERRGDQEGPAQVRYHQLGAYTTGASGPVMLEGNFAKMIGVCGISSLVSIA